MLQSVLNVASCISKYGATGNLFVTVRHQCMTAGQVLHSIPKPQITSIGNGLRVVSENNRKPTATVGVWIDGGSCCEQDGNSGVNNFLQHLFYKGTGRRTATELRNDLLKIGSRLLTYVDRDRVAVYTNCGSKDIEHAVEIIADVLRNSKLDNEAVELERRHIMKEIEANENDPSSVFELLHKGAFQGTSMENSLLGTVESVKAMDRNMLKSYLDEYYTASRMALVAVGDVDHATLVNLSNKYFGDLKAKSSHVADSHKIRFTGSEIRYRDDSLPRMYCAIAVEGYEFGHQDIFPLKVAQTIVGQWDQSVVNAYNSPSPLTRRVFAMPEIHSYGHFMTTYKNCGLFGLHFSADGEDLAHLITFLRAVQREWKFVSAKASDEDVEWAKNLLKMNVFAEMESNFGRADYIARSAIYSKELLSLEELERSIDEINKETVHDVVMRDLYDRDIAVSAIGRTEALPDYLVLRYGMGWWRL